MMTPLQSTRLFVAVLGALLLASVPRPARAQDGGEQPDADVIARDDAGTDALFDVGAGGDADAGVDADSTEDAEPAEGATDAKRIVRIRRVIELDKERLTWLRSELRSRKAWFEELATTLSAMAAERDEVRSQLELLDESERPAAAARAQALRTELEELEEDFRLLETQTDLALKAEKIIRQQIEALETKIEKERRALGRLTGEIPAELRTLDERTRVPLSADPVSEPTPSDAAPASQSDTARSSTMTAAQLQAEKILAQSELEVEIAEQELSEFIERKQALQEQIDFEQQLLEGDDKQRENLEAALAAHQDRLERYRAENASEEKIARRERTNRRIEKILEQTVRSRDSRVEYIESLNERLAHLEEAELRITEEVDEAQAEAHRVRRRVKWLQSPLHPQNLAYWAKQRGPRILLVVVAAALLLLFVRLTARRVARAVVRRRRDDRDHGTSRADTLAFSFSSVSRVLILIFGILLVLQEAGVDVQTVLGGAAILGVAVAFGAQDLMKDYLSGFLIILEDQYQLGDLVTISGVTGTVESVNMRITVLRDLEGRVHFIPNGNIDHVTNRTYAWGRPVFEIPVGFDEDVDRVMETLTDLAKELRDDPEWAGKIIGEPEMLGVDKFTEYGVIIKFMVKTRPDQLFAVRRELLRRVSKRFQELGIRITVPQRLIVRDGPGGEAL